MNASVLVAALLASPSSTNVTDSEDPSRTLVGVAVVLACLFLSIWLGTVIDNRAKG
jgi:hypothetical protein